MMEVLIVEAPRLRILVGLLILLSISLLVSWTARQPPGRLKLYFTQAGVVIAIVALVAMVFTGRLHWLFAAVGVVLPIIMRLMPLLRRAVTAQSTTKAQRGSSRSQSRSSSSSNSSRRSKVETRFLRMSLDYITGDMRGIVLRGTYQDRHLSELSLRQLRHLQEEYSRRDAESAALLKAYIDRMHGTTQQTQNAGAEQTKPDSAPHHGMTRDEAYEILGLKSGVDAQAVTEAHRRLMQKLHPDRGGTNYLAAKINQAKDLLLER
jgi:hypothetical protein